MPSFITPAFIAALDRAVRGAWYAVGGYVRDRLLDRPSTDLDVAVGDDPAAVARRLARSLGGVPFPLGADHGVHRVTLRAPVDGIDHIDVSALRGGIDHDLSLRDFTVNAMAWQPRDGLIDPFGGEADLTAGVLRLVSDTAIQDDPIRGLRAVRFVAELGLHLDEHSAAIIRRDAPLLARTAGERQRDELARILDTPVAAPMLRLADHLGLLDVLIPELVPGKGCMQPKEHYYDVWDHNVETVAVLDCILAPSGGIGERALTPAVCGGPLISAEGRPSLPTLEEGENGSFPSPGIGRGVASAASRGEGHPPPSPMPNCAERARFLWENLPDANALQMHYNAMAGDGRTYRSLLKLTGLLHDVAKPETRAVQPNGRVRFFGHEELGARIAVEVLERLRYTTRETRWVELLIADHLRPGQLSNGHNLPTKRALYRFFRDFGDAVPDLLLLNLADHASARGPEMPAEAWAGHVGYIRWILEQQRDDEGLSRPERLVTGHDLMRELGLSPGPLLGRLLEAIREAEAVGRVQTRDQALALARRLATRMTAAADPLSKGGAEA